MYEMEGKILDILPREDGHSLIIYNDVIVTEGQSGCPVFLIKDNVKYQIGVHVGHDEANNVNIATTITNKISDWLETSILNGESNKILGQNTFTSPVWVPDDEVHNCTICDTIFTFTTRKHHCRQCGNVICDNCSLKRKDINGEENLRVCDICFPKKI